MRLKVLYISPETLLELLKGTAEIKPTLPISYWCTNSGFSVDRNSFFFVFYDQSFDYVPIGEDIPKLELLLHKKNPNE